MQTVSAFKDGGWKLKKYYVTMTYVGYPGNNNNNNDFISIG